MKSGEQFLLLLLLKFIIHSFIHSSQVFSKHPGNTLDTASLPFNIKDFSAGLGAVFRDAQMFVITGSLAEGWTGLSTAYFSEVDSSVHSSTEGLGLCQFWMGGAREDLN